MKDYPDVHARTCTFSFFAKLSANVKKNKNKFLTSVHFKTHYFLTFICLKELNQHFTFTSVFF